MRNYMQDITPQSSHEERSIRNLQPSAARIQLSRGPAAPIPSRPPRRWSLWGALIGLILLGVAAVAFIVVPSTQVSVIPKTHVVSFGSAMPLTAYPAHAAATGTIAYTTLEQSFDESAPVPATGLEEVKEKASGTITIYNNFSSQSVRLIKNTRFRSPGGSIYRIPASVDIPGKKNASPGSIQVTAFADDVGPAYNSGPIDKLTLPGLASSDMYSGVYAAAPQGFSGGFVGQRPAVDPETLAATRAQLRSTLEEKARNLTRTTPAGSIAFAGVLAVRFESLPPTKEGDTVRINERAHVSVPVFPLSDFAHSIAQAVSTDVEGQRIHIEFSDDIAGESATPLNLGKEPITFTLSGKGTLVWEIDDAALSDALAGKSDVTFDDVVRAFPAIHEARARLVPPWRKTFPRADAIEVRVLPPQGL